MANKSLTVSDDIVVTLDYTLRLDDGEVVDSSSGEEPLQFLQGRGQIIPGLERLLYGMAIGDEKDVIIEATDAYGELDDDAFEVVPRDMFPDDLELEEGMGLRLLDRNSGEPVEAFIAGLRANSVMLDFNHPLAGETLYFHVEIAGLREATSEELDHGHVHDGE